MERIINIGEFNEEEHKAGFHKPPYFRNKDCPECFKEHNRIINRSKGGSSGFSSGYFGNGNPNLSGYEGI